MKESHGIAGRLHVELLDIHGRIIQHHYFDNLITKSGRKLIAQYLAGEVGQISKLEIAVGAKQDNVDTPEPQYQDNKLHNEIKRIEAHPSTPEDDQENPRQLIRVKADLEALTKEETEQKLCEAGIFITVKKKEGEEERAPVLYNRVTFPVITRTQSVSMKLAWELIF